MTKIKNTSKAEVMNELKKDLREEVKNEVKNDVTEVPKTGKEFTKKKGIPPITNNYPEHIVNIALIVKNNAEIKRFTALGILNYLLQKGEISGNSRYVNFKWNKFAVTCDGLVREFSYNETFFINALVAAFSSFSASAQRTIDSFCKKEMSVGINKAVDQEEVDNIIGLTDDYLSENAQMNNEESSN